MQKVPMTAAEFERIQSRLGRLTVDTVQIARRVLVDGKSQAEVAEETGLSRQRVSKMVQRVMAAANEFPPDWERVDEWMPPELAKQVRALAAEARTRMQEKIMLDEHEIEDRRRAVANAIASQRLEGLEVDAQTRAELDQVALGELEPADVIASIRRRLVAGD
ncbi:TrfB-related DNA-binding protein [Xanthomonas hortorum pv. vitians]|nr:TrfB-related DNA-binding protein [Xanthomonas hortorum]MCE4302531.1 TrfB-related DNA-binding protein [Xanthomonas hortorum pv. vitians]